MPRPTEDLVRIAEAGGGLTIDASMREIEDLIRIAEAARKSGGRVHITNTRMWKTDELVQVASVGQGCVSFDL
jgi:hypothetical protein